jgi:hypothetical protein
MTFFTIDGYKYEIGDEQLVQKLESWKAEERARHQDLYYSLMFHSFTPGQVVYPSARLMRALLKGPMPLGWLIDRGKETFKRLLRDWKECSADICTAIFLGCEPIPLWVSECIQELALWDPYYERLHLVLLAICPWYKIRIIQHCMRTNAGLEAMATAVCTGRVSNDVQSSFPPIYASFCDEEQIKEEFPQLSLFVSAGRTLEENMPMAAMLWMGLPGANAETYFQNFYQERRCRRDLELLELQLRERCLQLSETSFELEKAAIPLYRIGDFVYRAAVDLWLVLHDVGLPPYVIDQILCDSRHSVIAFIANQSRRIRCCQGIINSARAIREKKAAMAIELSQAIHLSKRARNS